MEKGAPPNDPAERVAILKRLKAHLLSQRDKLHGYLDLLDREEESIRSDNIDALTAQVALEKGIVEEIYSFQKVIDPLRDLYRTAYPSREPEISALETSLEQVRIKVLARNERNRNLLREGMANLRQEIKSLRFHRQAKSPYGDVDAPSVIDIRT